MPRTMPRQIRSLAARSLAALALSLTLIALPAAAQGPGGGPGGPGGPGGGPGAHGPHGDQGGPGPGGALLRGLAVYLQLSDEQVAAAAEIFAAAREAAAPLAAERRDLRHQLREALAVDPPDEAAVGALVVALDGNGEALAAIRQAAEDDFAALLSDPQRFRLQALRDARRIFGRHHGGPHGAGGGPGGDAGEGWFGELPADGLGAAPGAFF